MNNEYDKLVELLKSLKEQNRSSVLKIYFGSIIDGYMNLKF